MDGGVLTGVRVGAAVRTPIRARLETDNYQNPRSQIARLVQATAQTDRITGKEEVSRIGGSAQRLAERDEPWRC